MLHLIGIGLREAEMFKNGGVPPSQLPKDFEFNFVRKENNTFNTKILFDGYRRACEKICMIGVSIEEVRKRKFGKKTK